VLREASPWGTASSPLAPPCLRRRAFPAPNHPPDAHHLSHPPAPHAQTFLKAICANWFVCLAVWQALGANSFGGKFIACLGPVSAFVCIG
jgi:hypothetical protein